LLFYFSLPQAQQELPNSFSFPFFRASSVISSSSPSQTTTITDDVIAFLPPPSFPVKPRRGLFKGPRGASRGPSRLCTWELARRAGACAAGALVV
ncbi:hypothetical protein Tsubulata_030504, partial [Turnera subulata]